MLLFGVAAKVEMKKAMLFYRPVSVNAWVLKPPIAEGKHYPVHGTVQRNGH